jgi:CubicO group peptidase (beta-lactamase class C family)
VAVATVALSADSIDVALRATGTLTATPRDAAGQAVTGRTITWTSSEPAIASVSPTGVVSMLRPGSVTITATVDGRAATARVRGTVANLSAMVDSIRLATGVPAVGAAIVTVDGIIGIGVAGNRRAVGGLPVTINDKWHLGSNTKAITAMLAGMAVDAGVLSWDRTIAQAFPDLAAVTRPEYRPVTLRDLLSHVGGLVNTTTGLTASTNLPAARTAWMNFTLQQAASSARGQYNYSNNGFGAAGAIIERAWGGTFENLMSTRLLQPLGVVGAGWGPTTGVGGTDQPVGHSRAGSAWVVCEACDNAPGLSAAGTMHAPLAAWARIIQELLRADQGRSTLLTQPTARVLTTNAVPAGGGASYALGWGVATVSGERFVGHDGSNTLNHSRASLYLDSGLAFLVVTNAADLNAGTASVSGGTLGTLTTRINSYYNPGR